jgi:hypothetical protein
VPTLAGRGMFIRLLLPLFMVVAHLIGHGIKPISRAAE